VTDEEEIQLLWAMSVLKLELFDTTGYYRAPGTHDRRFHTNDRLKIKDKIRGGNSGKERTE
jgi:hypothetical protein